MARESSVFGYAATFLAVPPGATAALLVNPIAGQVWSKLKKFGGGSLEIYNAPVGATVSQTDGVAALNAGYLMAAAEEIPLDGAQKYYLAATGATATAYLLVGLGPMSSLGG